MEFEVIYQKYALDVYRYACALTHDTHLAEELTQETFYRSFTSLSCYNGDCSVYVWLCSILKHCYFNYLKKQKTVELETEIVSPNDLHDQIMVKIEYESLMKELDQFPDVKKQIIILHGYYQMTFQAIGDLLGKSENWCRVTFYRCKVKLNERRMKDENKL